MTKIYTLAAVALPVLMALPSVTTAQYKEDYARTAALFYSSHDYYSSAKYYELFLDSSGKARSAGQNPYVIQKQGEKREEENELSKNKLKAVYQLAESYRQLNDFVHAEKWYGKTAGDNNSNSYPLALYWYGISLRANGKYAEAEKALTRFIKTYDQPDNYSQSAKKELANLAFIKEQLGRKDSIPYTIQKLNSSVNPSGFANYAPVISGSTVYFTSTRRDTAAKGKDAPYFNNLYRFEKDSSTTGKAGVPESSSWEQGVASLTPDGKTLFLTRWQKNAAHKNMASLYISELTTAGTWSEPRPDSTLNLEGYNTQQPCVTADGKYLLFASDRPGGAGGLDIWYTTLPVHKKVANAGRQINTTGNEQAPYYHLPGSTLVFATDNRTGMGGYDLFSSKGDIISGKWTAPVNMGYPLNSIKDDIYFAGTDSDTLLKEAYLSSDRYSTCCLELYAVKTIPPPPPPPVVVITTTTEKPDSVPETSTTTIITRNDPPSKPVEIKIYFDFDKSTLLPVSYTMLDSLVTVLQKAPTLIIEIAGYADGKGTEAYNTELSQRRAAACYNYLVKQKHISADRLTIKAYGECCPAAKEFTEEGKDDAAGRKLNRRVEFKVSGVQ